MMRLPRISCIALTCASALACCAGQASAASHVYATSSYASRVDEYSAGANGALTEFGSVPVPAYEPRHVAMTSDGHNLYVVASERLEAFTVTATGGLVHKDAAHGGEQALGRESQGYGAARGSR